MRLYEFMKGDNMKYSIRKILVLGLCLIAGLLVMVGCGSEQSKQEPKDLHLTYVKSPLNIPSIVEKQNGIMEKAFKEKNIGVTYSEITEGPKQTAALESGDIDIATVLGGTSAILAKANGADIKIIGMYSRAPKAFVLITKNPNIQSVKDLKGKKVMGPKGTILHQLLLTALDKNGMTANDVEFINGGIPQAASALDSGDVDVAMVAGPVALKAIQQGARVVVSGEGYIDGSIVIATSGKFAKEHPELVKQYMDTHNQMVQAYEKDPNAYYDIVAKETGLTSADVATMAPWYNFDTTIADSDIKSLEASQDYLISIGMIPSDKKVDIQSMILR